MQILGTERTSPKLRGSEGGARSRPVFHSHALVQAGPPGRKPRGCRQREGQEGEAGQFGNGRHAPVKHAGLQVRARAADGVVTEALIGAGGRVGCCFRVPLGRSLCRNDGWDSTSEDTDPPRRNTFPLSSPVLGPPRIVVHQHS